MLDPFVSKSKEEQEIEKLHQNRLELKNLSLVFKNYESSIFSKSIDLSGKEKYLCEHEEDINESIRDFNILTSSITSSITLIKKIYKKSPSKNGSFLLEINSAESLMNDICPSINAVIPELIKEIDKTLYKFVESVDSKGKKKKNGGLQKILKPRAHLLKLESKVNKLEKMIEPLNTLEDRFYKSIEIYSKKQFFDDKPDIIKLIRDTEHLINQIKFHISKLFLLYTNKENEFDKFYNMYDKVFPFHNKFNQLIKVIEPKIENIINYIRKNFEILKDTLKEEKEQVNKVYQEALDNADKMTQNYLIQNNNISNDNGRDTFPKKDVFNDLRFSDIEEYYNRDEKNKGDKSEEENKGYNKFNELEDIEEKGELDEENKSNEKEEVKEGNKGKNKKKKKKCMEKNLLITIIIIAIILILLAGGFIYLKYF